MTLAPRDLTDLRLAPVALAVDAQLQSFADLDRDAIHHRIAVESNSDAVTRDRRERDVVQSATYLLDLGGWAASLDPRGIRLTHDQHTFVLGMPRNLVDYVDELLP